MIEIKVINLQGSRLNKIRDALGYLSSPDFLRTLPLADFIKDVSSYMERISPHRRRRQFTSGQPKLPHFANNWVVKRSTDGNRVFLTLDNKLNFLNFGGRAGIAKFAAIETGSTSSTWTAKRTFRFKYGPGKKQWAVVGEGSDWEHAASPAANVLPRTSDYIQDVLMPKIRQRVGETIERRMSV